MEDGGSSTDIPPSSPSDSIGNESLKPEYGEILRHPLRFLQVVSPFLTSHHPACPEFSLHTFKIRGRYWCIGCFFNTLSFVAGILILFSVWLTHIISFNRFFLFWGGIGGVLVYLIASGLHLTEIKRIKIFSKFLLGGSFAAVVWSILLANGLFSRLLDKAILIFTLYLVVVAALSIKRVLEIEDTCTQCEYKMDWQTCPGFKQIVSNLMNEGFLVPESDGEPSG